MLIHCYSPLLAIHSVLRWFVLIGGIGVLVGCLIGLSRKLSFAPLGRIVGLIYVSLLDTQFLVGVFISIASPVVQTFWSNPAIGMKQHDLRFFAVEHPTIMIGALVLAHIGAVKSRRATDAAQSYAAALVWYGVSLAFVLMGIPWWRF